VRVELKNLRASIASVRELAAAKSGTAPSTPRSADATSASGSSPGWERALGAYRHGLQSEKLTLYHPAIVDYSDAVELDPHNDSAFLHRAYCYYQLAEYENALLDLNRSLSLQPHNSWAYAVRASVYAAQGRNDLALKDADEAVSRDPKRAESYLLRGDLYRQSGATQNAIDDYTSAITLLPGAEKPYLARAAVLLNSGQTQRALQDCNRAIDLNSNAAGALLCRAECYLRTGDAALAIQDINRAKLAPENSGPMKELLAAAEELLDYGGKPGPRIQPQTAAQPQKAPEQKAETAAAEPPAAMEHRDAAPTLSKANPSTANPSTAKPSTAKPSSVSPSTASLASSPVPDSAKARQLEKTGRQLADQGKLEDALRVLVQAVELDPDSATAHNARGYVYLRLGQIDQAVSDFSDAIHFSPGYANAYLNRGAARALLRDPGASMDLRKAEQLARTPQARNDEPAQRLTASKATKTP
jgi:tetratricopeptide (TPR) repeat protein